MHSLCFQRIPNDMLSEEQRAIVLKYSSSANHHFGMIHQPPTLHVLIAFLRAKERPVLWIQQQQNGWSSSCCVSNESFPLDHGSTAKSRLVLSMQNYKFCLTGTSDENVAQLAAMLWSLPQADTDELSCVHIHGPSYNSRMASFDYNALGDASILPSLLSQRKVTFMNVQVPNYLAFQLASQPRSVDLTLFDSTFVDDGTSFLQALSQRRRDTVSSSFGTLTLNGCSAMPTSFLRQLHQMSDIEWLRIITYDRTARTRNRLSFASNASKVEYEMVVLGHDWKCIDSITLVPKRFILKMTRDEYEFTSVYLQATTSLVEMGLITRYGLTKETQLDLMAAVDRNQSLRVLEFGPVEGISLLAEWQDLMKVLGRHTCLCKLTLHCHCYHECMIDVDEKLRIDSLVYMVKTNRNIIEIDVVSVRKQLWMNGLKSILHFNRVFQGSRSIKHKSESERIQLLGRAILESEDDPQMLALLLSDHMDVICMLLLNE